MSTAQTQPTQYKLDEQMLHRLVPHGRRRRWKSGQPLALCGQRMEHVSICLSGQYKVLLNGVSGNSQFMRMIGRGEMFGVPSALADAPFPTDLMCEEDGETLEIAGVALLRMLREEPELALSVIRSLASRVAELFELMEADLLPSLGARVYQRLQRLARFNGTPDQFGHIELLLSQHDIAQSLNASRPRVQQELKRLEREGVIRLGYRRITLLRPL